MDLYILIFCVVLILCTGLFCLGDIWRRQDKLHKEIDALLKEMKDNLHK